MKDFYETPQFEIVEFETEDIITASNVVGELPFVPVGQISLDLMDIIE